MSHERWRRHPVYVMYEISCRGRVRNRKTGQVLRDRIVGRGYRGVSIRHAGAYVHTYVHRLVLETFVRAAQPGEQTRHRNGNPADNRLRNLCWGSQSDNEQDKRRHGTYYKRYRKLSDADVRRIRAAYAAGELQRVIAARYGVTQPTVSEIVRSRTHKNLAARALRLA